MKKGSMFPSQIMKNNQVLLVVPDIFYVCFQQLHSFYLFPW